MTGFQFQAERYPTGWLVSQLCDIYSVSVFGLSVLIGYKNLTHKVKLRTSFTDDTIIKIKEFIKNNGNSEQKQEATNALRKFVRIRVFNTFKNKMYPKINKFQIEDFPAGWLVLKLCETYFILINSLAKYIDYEGLDKSLLKRQEFTNYTLDKIKEFILNDGTKEQNEKAFQALRRYIRIRVFNQIKTMKYQRFNQFQVEFFPTGWLIMRLCEIFLVLPNGLEDFIGYTKMNRTLQDRRKFAKKTIRRIERKIDKCGTFEQKIEAKEVIRIFENARIPKTFNIKRFFELVSDDLLSLNPYFHPIFASELHRALKYVIQLGRCLYTGEKLRNGSIGRNFHHINYDKINNDMNNLGFIDDEIHHVVIHPYNNPKIAKEIRENLKDLLNGFSPQNWRGIELSNYEIKLLTKRQNQNYWLIRAYNELEKYVNL